MAVFCNTMHHLKPPTPIYHCSNRHALPTLDRLPSRITLHHDSSALSPRAHKPVQSYIVDPCQQSDHDLLQDIYGIYICLPQSAFRFRSSQLSSLLGTRRGYSSIDFVNRTTCRYHWIWFEFSSGMGLQLRGLTFQNHSFAWYIQLSIHHLSPYHHYIIIHVFQCQPEMFYNN